MMEEGPLEEEDMKKGVEDHQIEAITMIEVTLQEEGPLMMDYLLMMDYPLMMEDPLGMDKIQDALEDEDHQACQELLDQLDLL